MGEPIMVKENVRPYLKNLSKLAPEINKASDLYTAELKEIEKELNELNLGVEVELYETILEGNRSTEDNEWGQPTGVCVYSGWTLGYGKHSLGHSEWCLFARRYTIYSDDREWCEENTTPLLEASRDIRIAAAEEIPALLAEIEKQVKAKIEALRKASDRS